MQIKEGALQVLPTDRAFDNSPDTGHRDCKCSRCGQKIQEHETAIRVWPPPADQRGQKITLEYRYCELCMTGKKYFYCKDYRFTSYQCRKQCQECQSETNN